MKAEQAATHVPHWVDDRPPTVEEVGDDDWVPCKTGQGASDAHTGYHLRYHRSDAPIPWLANIPPYVKAERFTINKHLNSTEVGPYVVKAIADPFQAAYKIPTREQAEAIKAIYERGAK